MDNGNVVVLRGVNRSGSEYMCTSGGALTFDGPSDDASIAAMASWNINVVRVPLNEDCWLGINGYPASMTSAVYQQAIVGYVNRLHTHGLYAILELHWNAPGTQQSSGQQVMADADHAPTFWTSVATTFKADPKVVFDLYNEPHGISWACLRDGCMAGFQTAGMQSLVNAVRATGATQPLLAGGLGYSNDLSQWLSFKPSDSQLAASLHTYNFNSCATQSCWTSTVLPVAGSVPVVAGELGEDDCAHGYIDGFMNWADANGISYLGWAWDTYDCSNFPSLISAYDGTPTNFGIGFKNHLPGLPALPAITSVSPNDGPIGGGTSVTITGTNFTGATAVKFDTTGAASFAVNNATQITATSPAGSGAVDVRVTTAGGTSAISGADHFTYTSPPPPLPFKGLYTLDGFGGIHGDNSPAVTVSAYWPGWSIARSAKPLPGASAPQTGFVLDGYGGLHPYGSPAVVETSGSGGHYWGWDIARDFAFLPDGSGGFVLDGYGGLHPFRVNGSTAPLSAQGGSYWGWDIARKIVIFSDGSGGYVLDGFGGLHPFGINGPPPASVTNLVTTGYWGWSIARDIVLAPGNGNHSGYVLDGYGGLHPFHPTTDGSTMPAASSSAYWGLDIARGVWLLPGSASAGYTLDGYGGMHPFGGSPAITSSSYWPGWDIARGVFGA